MDFPIELSNTFHKHGGRITRVEKISHTVARPTEDYSRDFWFFIGDVEWHDGGKSTALEIAPYALCYDDDNKEVLALSEELNNYLLAHGEWYDRKSKHEGWYANR